MSGYKKDNTAYSPECLEKLEQGAKRNYHRVVHSCENQAAGSAARDASYDEQPICGGPHLIAKKVCINLPSDVSE
jgi:hypothetical protein